MGAFGHKVWTLVRRVAGVLPRRMPDGQGCNLARITQQSQGKKSPDGQFFKVGGHAVHACQGLAVTDEVIGFFTQEHILHLMPARMVDTGNDAQNTGW